MLSESVILMIKNLPTILSVKEATKFFRVDRKTVCRLIYSKRLLAYKDDEGNWCILREDLKKFCSKNSNL